MEQVLRIALCLLILVVCAMAARSERLERLSLAEGTTNTYYYLTNR